MHLAATVGCVPRQLSQGKWAGAREGLRALGPSNLPLARKDWEPGGVGPVPEMMGILS